MTGQRIPKQYFTVRQVREILALSLSGLIKLDKELRPIRIGARRDRRYDSVKVLDYIDKLEQEANK